MHNLGKQFLNQTFVLNKKTRKSKWADGKPKLAGSLRTTLWFLEINRELPVFCKARVPEVKMLLGERRLLRHHTIINHREDTVKSRRIGLVWQCGLAEFAIQQTTKMSSYYIVGKVPHQNGRESQYNCPKPTEKEKKTTIGILLLS